MKRSLVPVIYDFKRSFLRASTLVLLVLFIVAGIGLSYLSYSIVSNLAGPVRTLGIIAMDNGNATVYGVAYDLVGRQLSGAKILFLDKMGRTIYESRVDGLYHLSFKAPINDRIARVRIIYNGKRADEDVLPLNYVNKTYYILYYANPFSLTESDGVLWMPPDNPRTYAVVSLIMLDKSSGEALLQVLSFNTADHRLKPNYELIIGYMKLSSNGPDTTYINASKLPHIVPYKVINISDPYVRYRVKLDPSYNAIVVRVNGSNETLIIRYDRLRPAKGFMIESMLSSSGLQLFLNFFPIVFLYLAYKLISKPKASGALEFILARPVTKWDLYVTRYVSGVLTALVSSAIFVVALDIGFAALWGIAFGAYTSFLLFLAIFLGLVAWYSFCYLLSSGLKSSSGYLALSIVFYLLFAMFWGLITFLVALQIGAGFTGEAWESLSYKLSMLNPIKVSDLIIYYVRLHYGLVTPIQWINPGIVAGAILAWIVVPFILGYLVFKKD